MGKDYYNILGVAKGADDAELKKGAPQPVPAHACVVWQPAACACHQPCKSMLSTDQWAHVPTTAATALLLCSLPQASNEMAPGECQPVNVSVWLQLASC